MSVKLIFVILQKVMLNYFRWTPESEINIKENRFPYLSKLWHFF